ncbi:MAG TPA: protein kinase, partial [Polyangiales bacterium]|nr:protein kinase [Polyangiales bacterium]
MTATADDGRAGPPDRIAQRYRVVRELGRGGMASVYEVVEEATGRRLAVKQLLAERAAEDSHVARLFELEFHTLTQLAHPRVVEVYDYHKSSDGAYYSMELLDGGDLREQQVLPWKQVCALLCDVCSALSLLHSRRLVHRDVTPRNIRLTHDGKAKLIDFGAMVPFGTHTHRVGTPAFTAPEAVHGQPLDGRADLFSLGATAYYALTGRHAYPSRSFANVRNAWRTQPAVPSRYVEDIPPELDQLVMSLLSLAVARRPASAAAVIERLTALADLQIEEQLLVQRSFLSTPTLVGRDADLQQIRRQTIQAARGRGSVLFITGPRGIGRSRLVNACALEAKLASATLLRADANDARDGEWGGVRSLLDQLTSELPDQAQALIAPHERALAQVWPRALEGEPERAVVHGALLKLMLDVAHHSFLVVTADDLDRVDEPTRAFIALLAQQVAGRRILIVTAAASEDVARGIRGLRLLQREANTIELQALSLTETERLVISMFGDVPNVRMLASRLFEVSGGSPATSMQLSQYLLDREIVGFRDGSWILPATLERDALPSSLTDALRARLMLLDAAARSLGRAMALSAEPSLQLEQCQQLMAESERGRVLTCLDALIAADVVRPVGERYALSQPVWTTLLLAELDPVERRQLHERVGDMFLQQPNNGVRAAEHLLACGRELEAIDQLLAQLAFGAKRFQENPASLADHLRQLPANWIQTVEAAAMATVRLGQPRRKTLAMQLMLLQRLALPTLPRCDIAREVVHQLYVDSGLRDYAELSAVPEPDRLGQAYARAQARYDATPEHDRGFPPGEAIGELARLHVVLIAMVGASADLAFLRELPSLTPFTPLSPAIALVQRNVECSCHMMAGQLEQAHAGYLEILERMDAPDGAGLAPSVRRYMRLAIIYAIAVIETTTGRASAAERVNLLLREPLFELNAWRLRSNWAFRQGNAELADAIVRKVELLRISNAPSQFFEGSEAWYEAVVFAELGDVPRLRTTLSRLDRMASAFRNWRAAPLFARGQIQLLRGDASGAVALFEEALAACAAGEMACWARTARGLLEALVEAGRAAEACTRGARLLAQASDAGLTVQCGELYLALTGAQLAAGDTGAALAQLHELDALRERWPIGDAFGGKCFELRARIAIATSDAPAFEGAARECNAIYSRSKNPILIGRYQRLIQDAERAGFQASASLRPRGPDDALALETERTRKLPRRFELDESQSFEERTQRVLRLVGEHAAARHVRLYLLRGQGPSLVAATERFPADPRMDTLVSEFLQQELEHARALTVDPDDVVTTTVDNSGWTGPTGVQFVPALLSHSAGAQLAVTGVVVFDIDGHTQPNDEVLSRLSAALAAAGDVE